MGSKLWWLGILGVVSLWGESSWYDQKLEGWYYFEEAEAKQAEKPVSLDEAEEVLEIEKHQLRKLLSLALLQPTQENVEQYITHQKRWLDQSALFSATWGKVLLEKPMLGDFLSNPTTNYGIHAKRELDMKKRQSFLQELSKTYFLVFFFRGKDPLSEKAAEMAEIFSRVHGWNLRAVSLDGLKTKGLEVVEIDKGMSLKLGVEAVPAFFVVNPFEETAIPVGAGLISMSELEQNIEAQMSAKAVNE